MRQRRERTFGVREGAGTAAREPVSTLARVLALAVSGALVLGILSPSEAAPPDVPLIEAVKSQDLEAVRRLLLAGASVNESQPDGATALHWAAFREDGDLVAALIDAGADVGVANELGATPLWVASITGNTAIITRLLDAGADPNVSLPEGETPLMTASRAGQVGAVEVLLQRGADPDRTESARGQTALMWAVAQRHPDVVEVLIRNGASVNVRSKVRPRLVFSETVNASQYDQGILVNEGGFTPILFAARQGGVRSAERLLEAGADVNDTAPTGASALVVAAHSGHADMVAFLLERGADPNADGAGYAALHAAVLRGDQRMVRTLLDGGADPNVRLTTGTPVRRASQDWQLRPQFVTATPFWLAARYREPEIMRILVAAGADSTLTTLERFEYVKERAGGVGPPRVVGGFETPLMAALRGRSDRGRLFLGAEYDDREAEEALALETVRLAVELGNDIDAQDETGTTALHSAAAINFRRIVRYLAEQGAELSVKNEAGQTPLSIATLAERRRARRQDTAEDGPSTADVLRTLGAKE